MNKGEFDKKKVQTKIEMIINKNMDHSYRCYLSVLCGKMGIAK